MPKLSDKPSSGKLSSKGSFSQKERKDMVNAMSLISQVGITILVCITLGVVIGSILDRWLDTSPWMLLLFCFFGIASAFKSLYNLVKRYL